MIRIVRLGLMALSVMLAACVGGPASVPQPTLPVLSPTPLPTVLPPSPEAAASPTPTPLDCGPEAAIAFAQTQSDLALAADAVVEGLRQANADAVSIAQAGINEYMLARDLMRAYAVPACLLQAKVFADQFFTERIEAYAALLNGDQAGYELHLGNGEIARQNMITVVNGVLGQ